VSRRGAEDESEERIEWGNMNGPSSVGRLSKWPRHGRDGPIITFAELTNKQLQIHHTMHYYIIIVDHHHSSPSSPQLCDPVLLVVLARLEPVDR
jgi:hypothetical protein